MQSVININSSVIISLSLFYDSSRVPGWVEKKPKEKKFQKVRVDETRENCGHTNTHTHRCAVGTIDGVYLECK